MNWLQKLIIGKELDKLEQKYNQQLYPNLQPGIKYPVQNGRFISPPDNMTTFIRDGYSMNDIIYSVINMILDKIRLPEWNIYKVVDESSLKRYRSLIQRKNLTGREYKQALQLKETSLEPISNFNLQLGKLKDLLTYPNDYCTFQDLVGELMMFKLLTGNNYLWGQLLKAGANAGLPDSMNILPAQFVNIKVTESFPAEPYKYLLYNPWNIEFATEEILHNKYANPNWDINGQQLYGMSPLKAALKNITRNNSAKDSSTAKFQNGGLEEIVYFDDPAFQGPNRLEQMRTLKNELSNKEYAGPDAQGKFTVSGYKMGKVGLGLSPVELAIIESEKWDAIMICNIYGVPADLVVPEHRTFNNAKEAEKALTSRSALPLLTSFRNDFNRKVMTDWGGFSGIFIDYDIQCFTELQTDLNETADWTSKVIAISPNDQLEFLGQDRYKDPILDEPWVMQNGSRVPLSDFQVNPIDNILNQMANGTGSNAAGLNGNGAGSGNQAAGNGKVSQNGVGKNMSH